MRVIINRQLKKKATYRQYTERNQQTGTANSQTRWTGIGSAPAKESSTSENDDQQVARQEKQMETDNKQAEETEDGQTSQQTQVDQLASKATSEPADPSTHHQTWRFTCQAVPASV